MAKNNRICKISSRRKGICFIIIILVIGITSLSLVGHFLVHSTNNSASWIYPSREVSQTIQWVNNSGFDTQDNWEFVSINQGAGIDTEGDIDTTQGQANLNILGNRGEFNDISGIPNNSEWIPTINTNFPILPNSYGIDEFGCFASHTWIDPHDPNQSVSIHWERNITLPLNLKDYNITSVSLNAIFNASVLTVGSDPSFPYRGGIDVINDSIGDRVDEDREFDYTRFYVLISDVQKEFSAEELAYFQTTDLGKDSNPEISNISNQHMLVRSEDDLRRYLSSALERDPLHRSFTLIIGMRIFCADNGQEDRDDWTSLRINTLNFSFSYEKIIDKSSSIVLKQSGKEITGENVQINSANLNFDCMINTTWPKLKSENSEIRININNKEHNERIDLSDINNIFSEILADGFDIAYLINPYEILNLSIQIFLGDTFGLNESIAISVDNVNMIIQYTEIFSDVSSEPWYTNLLFLGSLIGLGVLGTYFTAYYTLLKYPKPIRKVRKFRKSLNKQNIPNIKVKNKIDSIRAKYNRSSSISGKIGKGKAFKATNFLLVSLLFLSLVCMISLNLSSNHGIERGINCNNININNISPSREIPYSSQWMLNPKFDTMGSWTFIYGTEGDNSDISGNINNFQSNFNILGNLHTFNASSGIPTETDWKNMTNPNFPDKPDNYQINSNGCSVSHYWSEKADQAPSIHWDKNITMPEDMSDYVITSIDLSVIVNASVETESGNNDNINFPTLIGLDCPGDLVNNSATYDYAKFYVLISDLAKDKTYEVAYNQTVDLGKNGTNGLMADTELKVISQDKLIEYLTSVLETDNQNFTITLGLRLWCEDNWYNDADYWNELLIKSCDLTISYAKKVDQSTSISLFQEGDKINGENVRITDGNLKFKYSINDTWPQLASPSSEIRVLINGNPHSETIRLTSAINGNYQLNKGDGYDVTDLLLKDTNITLSIQLYLADTFELNRTIQVSIDDVYLQISYVEVIFDITSEPWFNTALFIGVLAITSALSIYFLVYYQVLRFPIPIRKIRKYRNSLADPAPPKGVITSDRESDFRKAFIKKLGDYSRGIPTKGPKSSFK